MKIITLKYLSLISFFLLVLSCSEQKIKPEKFELGRLFDFKSKNYCKNVFLIKKRDCISCELHVSELIRDPSIQKNSFYIIEGVRKIEQKSFLKERAINQHYIFSDSIIHELLKKTKTKFNSSIIITLSAKNEIVSSKNLRQLLALPENERGICYLH